MMTLTTPGSNIFDFLTASPVGMPSSGGESMNNPTAEDIKQAFDAMLRGDIEYVILTNEDTGAFIQAAGVPDEYFVLEYQEGSVNQHFRATNPDLTPEKALNAFLNYNRGESAWKLQFTWEHVII
jgi:hypothetical protein